MLYQRLKESCEMIIEAIEAVLTGGKDRWDHADLNHPKFGDIDAVIGKLKREDVG
jgi:hypothetical protein